MQWYPGHIARAEKLLREQLKAVDAVVEVRDIRIPLATTHPDIPEWIGSKLRVLVLNRADMVSDAERGALVQVEDGGLELFGFGAKAIQFTDFARGVNPFTSR